MYKIDKGGGGEAEGEGAKNRIPGIESLPQTLIF